MARLRILCVGKTKAPWVDGGVQVFAKRLQGLAQVQFVEIRDQRGAANPAAAVARESGRILKQATPGFWLLDERGKGLRSVELAQRLQRAQGDGVVDIVVGGAHGVSDEVKAAAGETIALSQMTLTHEMAKLLLVEQVYRACNINAGGQYHHGD